MPKLMRRAVVAFKQEVTFGVDPVPTGAANAILVRDLSVTPIEQELASRDLIRPYLGSSENLPVSNHFMVEFSVELAGSGTAGTAPAWAPVLMACGFGEADGASDVVYTPKSTAFTSGTLYVNIDGVLHETNGAAGNVAFSMDARSIPMMRFSFRGTYVPVIDAAALVPVYTAFRKPVPVNRQNTTLSLHGVSAVVETLQLDMKNEYPYRNLIGYDGVTINDRKPDGSLSMEMVSAGTKDWFASIAAATTGALEIVHGTVAGNIIEIDAPAVQLVSPRFADSQGIQMLQANLLFMPVSGNDEITITVK